MKTSWKTTAAGYMAGVGFVLLLLAKLLDPSSNLGDILEFLGLSSGGVGGLLLGAFARDDDVSSEGMPAPKSKK